MQTHWGVLGEGFTVLLRPLSWIKVEGREEWAGEVRKRKEGTGRFAGGGRRGNGGNHFPEKCGEILNGRLGYF